MAQVHTHYDNLKVVRNAPPEVIRAAYRTLSKKYHPDHHPDNPDAVRIIQLINSAYEVLSDPVRRQEHDRWIERQEAQKQENHLRRDLSSSADGLSSYKRHGTRSSSHQGMKRAVRKHTGIIHKLSLACDQLLKIFYRKA